MSKNVEIKKMSQEDAKKISGGLIIYIDPENKIAECYTNDKECLESMSIEEESDDDVLREKLKKSIIKDIDKY